MIKQKTFCNANMKWIFIALNTQNLQENNNIKIKSEMNGTLIFILIVSKEISKSLKLSMQNKLLIYQKV